MTRSPMKVPALNMLVVLSTGFVVPCAIASIPPNKVCEDGRVDRQKLAEYLLDTYKYSWRIGRYEQEESDQLKKLTPEQQLIARGVMCDKIDKKSCTESDYQAMVGSFVDMQALLANRVPGFHSDGRATSVQDYFLDDDAVISCPRVPPVTPSEDSKVGAWRVRGSADQLYMSQASPLFAAADKLQIGLSNDKVQKKTTKRIVGDVGYAFVPEDSNETYVQIVPYVGINDNSTHASGKGRTYTADTRNAGVAFTYEWSPTGSSPRPSTAYVFSLRPDYLWNRVNKSRLATLNANFLPAVAGKLNDRIVDSDVIVTSLFDVRLNHGHYTSEGTASPGTLHDYLRVGSRFGLGLSSPSHPLEWLVTATVLHGFSGKPGNIHYLSSTFSLGLDPKKNFALGLTYSTGRREDTGERERGWNLTFGAKY